MRARKWWVLPTLVLPLMLAACPPNTADRDPALRTDARADAPVDVQAEVQAVRDRSQQWFAAAEARNLDGIAGIYADDATVYDPDRPEPVRGRGAIRDYYGEFLQMPNVQMSGGPTQVEVAQSGDLAYEIGDFSFAADGPEGRLQDSGRYLAVWRKRNGEWQIVAEMSQSTQQPQQQQAPTTGT